MVGFALRAETPEDDPKTSAKSERRSYMVRSYLEVIYLACQREDLTETRVCRAQETGDTFPLQTKGALRQELLAVPQVRGVA